MASTPIKGQQHHPAVLDTDTGTDTDTEGEEDLTANDPNYTLSNRSMNTVVDSEEDPENDRLDIYHSIKTV